MLCFVRTLTLGEKWHKLPNGELNKVIYKKHSFYEENFNGKCI